VSGASCRRAAVTAALLVAAEGSAAEAAKPPLRLEPRLWRIVERESGPDNYFTIVESPEGPFLRADYRYPMKTAVLGVAIPEADRRVAARLTWRWRIGAFPVDADECTEGKEDSAAAVYASWRRGLRWYALKYVWSTTANRGTVCARKRNPFVAQDTVVLESAGPTGAWERESIDLADAFRRHFERGDASADVPPFMGVGIMSDGDQTRSRSAADYADFLLERR